tara:strand:- start:22031 stop:22231 length:201 start_codon:yes stop_codon:yes gene_type:complete
MFKLNKIKASKRDSRTYKNFKYWPLLKLKEIIEHPNHQGLDGHDYGPYIEEIKQEYYRKLNSKYAA